MLNVIPGVEDFPMGVATKLRGADLGMVERTVSGLIEPRRIRPCASRQAADIRISHVAMNLGHLFGVQHGAAVHVTSAPIRSYQIMVPLRGQLIGYAEDSEMVAAPGAALVYSPQDCLNTYWSDDCIAVVLSVPSEKLKALARATFPGVELSGMPTRSLMALTEGGGRSFANVLGIICQESVDPDSAFSRGLTTKSLEETLLLSLLLAQKQNARLHCAETNCSNRITYVGRALDYIDAHCTDEISLSDLLRSAEVSARTLQYGFLEQFGVGPMTYLKQIRVRHIHDTLRKAQPGSCSIGDVAAHWGFYNGSAFARIYRKMFGELPSVTLSRR